MVGDCMGNVWGMCGGVMGVHMGYCWMVMIGRRVLRVMAMVRDLSGIFVGS